MVSLQQSQYEDKIAARKLILENELARIVSVLVNEYEPHRNHGAKHVMRWGGSYENMAGVPVD